MTLLYCVARAGVMSGTGRHTFGNRATKEAAAAEAAAAEAAAAATQTHREAGKLEKDVHAVAKRTVVVQVQACIVADDV
eukprot:5016819-Prymnesium_polylepis.1